MRASFNLLNGCLLKQRFSFFPMVSPNLACCLE